MLFLMTIDDQNKRDKLEELYLTYRSDIYNRALRFTKDPGMSEDIVQNVIIKIADNMEKITDREPHEIRSYLLIASEHMSLNMLRKQKKEWMMDLTVFEQEDPEQEIDEQLLTQENAEYMAKVMGKLHPDYAQVLMLSYYHQLDNQEIAAIMDTTVELVHTKVSRARKTLKKMLMEEDYYSEYHSNSAEKKHT